VTAKGKQWAQEELRLSQVQQRLEFQLRVNGLDQTHVNRLKRVLEAGGSLPAVSVARVGKALYLVDGFHRLEAHRRAHRGTVLARVARMSLPEAQEEARLANTTHGKALSRADKNRVWEEHVAAGLLRDASGTLKTLRTIEADLNHLYSRETVRKRLSDLGLTGELQAVDPFKPRAAADAELPAERLEEAERLLQLFGDLFPTLAPEDQPGLLVAARDMLEALERGDTPEMVKPWAERLDI